jgi:hypothetical protein
MPVNGHRCPRDPLEYDAHAVNAPVSRGTMYMFSGSFVRCHKLDS